MSSNLAPRLASSLKWTDLPGEFTRKIRTVFDNQFKTQAISGEFLVEGRIYPEEAVLRVGYLEKGRLKQINFEASMDLVKNKETSKDSAASEETEGQTLDRLYTCIDALGSLMEEYFQVGDESEMDIPLRWRPYEFEGATVYLQHSTVNTRLEEEADRILGLLEKQLIHEDSSTEDALGNAEVDSELAFEVQKLIREGKHPLQSQEDPDADPEKLN
jgi:hypothetical protein